MTEWLTFSCSDSFRVDFKKYKMPSNKVNKNYVNVSMWMSIRYPTEDIWQLTQSDRHTNVFGQKASTT